TNSVFSTLFLHDALPIYKFGAEFDDYTKRVHRWLIDFRGLGATLNSMEFNYRRWLLKEYNTLFVWLVGIVALIHYKYPFLFSSETLRNGLLIGSVFLLFSGYMTRSEER